MGSLRSVSSGGFRDAGASPSPAIRSSAFGDLHVYRTGRPAAFPHQKLVVFTEHRDTLRSLQERSTTLLGRQTSVVVIHGSVSREERLAAQFRHDPQAQVLLATDAAGEGLNPNRLEQRFGRIPSHRPDPWTWSSTRSARATSYRRLLKKLEQARLALGG